MYRIIAHRYPNNEIRTVFTAIPNPRTFSYEDSPETPLNLPFDISSPDVIPGNSPIELCYLVDGEKNPVPPLSLDLNSKPERSSAGYGLISSRPTSFGLNAKRQLIRSGAALETEAAPQECLFLTGTLPGSTEDAFKAIAAYSGYIVNSLKAWIAKRVTQKLDFYCWELQKRGALHLHYCCHIPCESDRLYILGEFRNWWIQILSRIGDRSNCDLFRKNSKITWLSNLSKVRAVAEVCRKSPARYLSKYLSKSARSPRGRARAFSPSRWWGTSRPLKKLLESLTDVCEILVGNYHSTIKKMECVKAICDSSNSVTYRYRHKYGIGHTSICYANSHLDNEDLWISLKSLSTMTIINSRLNTVIPSEVLKVRKKQLIVWSSHWSNSLTVSHQGLRSSLVEYLNMIQTIIPSQSSDVLNLLMFWAARTSDIRSLSQFTPALSPTDKRMLDGVLDDLEICLNLVAEKGWY